MSIGVGNERSAVDDVDDSDNLLIDDDDDACGFRCKECSVDVEFVVVDDVGASGTGIGDESVDSGASKRGRFNDDLKWPSVFNCCCCCC